jgi:hypothetical protein
MKIHLFFSIASNIFRKRGLIKQFIFIDYPRSIIHTPMEPTPRVLNHLPERSAGSHLALSGEDIETSGALRKWRSVTHSLIRKNKRETTSLFWSYELLYKMTDAVLVISGIIFVFSSIASVVLWLYAFIG